MIKQIKMATRLIYSFLFVFIVILNSDYHLNAQGFIIYQDKTFGTQYSESYVNRGNVIYFQGHFYILGTSYENVGGDKSDSICEIIVPAKTDLWLIKIDLQLNKIWDKSLGGNNREWLPSISINSSDLIVLTSSSCSDSSCEKTENTRYLNLFDDFWILAVDTNGSKFWDKTFGGDHNDIPAETIEFNSGNYIICGSSTSMMPGYDKSVANWGNGDYWCVKFDSSKNKIWDKVYGGTGGEAILHDYGKALSIIKEEDDSFVLAGCTNSPVSGNVSQPNFGPGYQDIWIMKSDSTGNKLWDKRYGGAMYDNASKVIKITGGYMIVGSTTSPQSGSVSDPYIGGIASSDVWLIKVDTAWNKVWDRRYGSGGGVISELTLKQH